MGKEETDANPDKAPKIKIPVGSKPMGHEKEQGLEGGDNRYTGGDGGQGKASHSTREQISNLADRIIEAQEKKVVRKPPQDDEDVKPYSAGDQSFLGDEKASIGSVPKADPKPGTIPATGNGFLGDEKASIGEQPTDKDTPSIPVKDERIDGEKDNKEIAPEKEENVTGLRGANASSEKEPKDNANEAIRIAGRMLANHMITANSLSQKIAELQSYKIHQLHDLEKGMFVEKKGLAASSDGIEQPVIIGQASSDKEAQNRNNITIKEAQSELTNKLQSIFSLDKQNVQAEQDNNAELRKVFNR